MGNRATVMHEDVLFEGRDHEAGEAFIAQSAPRAAALVLRGLGELTRQLQGFVYGGRQIEQGNGGRPHRPRSRPCHSMRSEPSRTARAAGRRAALCRPSRRRMSRSLASSRASSWASGP